MPRKRRTAAAACRLLTVLLILATLQARPVQASNTPDPGASAGSHDLSATAAPHLGRADIALYRQIFALQERADWAGADRLIARLSDPVLLGYVLYQRYMHPTGYRSNFEELSGWLELYADHPDAERVYSLALRRRPAGAPRPQDPVRGYLAGAGQELQERGEIRYRSSRERAPVADVLVENWQDAIERLSASGHPDAAERELGRPEIEPLVDAVEFDLARWTVARGYLATGNPQRALGLALRAAAGSGQTVPEVHWTAGLSAWRLGLIHLAAWHFARLADVDGDGVLPADRARAALWAARD